MAIEVGNVFEGRVTGVKPFGAFVALPDGKSGLVHISEVAGTFVSDVHDFLIWQTIYILITNRTGKFNHFSGFLGS